MRKTRGFLVAAGVSLALAFTLSCSGEEAAVIEGIDGNHGKDGVDGNHGIDGKDGADGVDGNHGIDGKDGADGADGNHGVDGKDGADGVDGVDGNHGINGEDGKDGEKGDTGAKGDTGEKGDKGDTGEKGDKGDTGAKGDKGDTGAKGEDGADGTNCAVEDKDTTFVMICGGVEKATWAKAMCGIKAYDPEKFLCKRGKLLPLCGKEAYEPDVQMCDLRDNKIYKIVEIGTQIWLAENLNYAAEGSKCYDNLESNCDIHGRLYDWSKVMGFLPRCNSNYCLEQIESPHQGICPAGWHIPSNSEWVKLATFAGGLSVAGGKLKAEIYGGTDEYKFSALMSGGGFDEFEAIETLGYCWIAQESTYLNDANNAYFYTIYKTNNTVSQNKNRKDYLKSVRCLKDTPN